MFYLWEEGRTGGDGECPATTEERAFDHVASEESAGDADDAEDDLLWVTSVECEALFKKKKLGVRLTLR